MVAFSQEEATFSIKFKNERASDAFNTIEKIYDVRFSYQDSLVNNKFISLKRNKRTLSQVIEEIEINSTFNFEKINQRYIIVKEKEKEKEKVLSGIQILDNILITGYLTKGIQKNKDATFTIKPKKLEILPGLIEADILESIQLLPGIVSLNETATGFTVRGGSLDQNRIIWDGINMYHKGHLFGMLSAFNPNSTSDVIFHNKGTHSRFGERVSSVIDISSMNSITDKFVVGIGVNGINVDAYLEAPIIEDKLSLQVAMRRSYTELFQSPSFNKIAKKVFQNTKIDNIENTNNKFNFLDYNIKLNFKLNENNSFYASTIYIDNSLDYLVRDQDLNDSYNDILAINNDGFSLGWDKKWNQNLSQNTQLFLSRYSLAYNFISSKSTQMESNFEKRNEIYDSGLSTEFGLDFNKVNNLTFGYQYVLKDVSYLFKETADLTIILDQDKTIVRSHSVYLQYLYKNPKLFDISLGLRTNYYEELDAVRFEPRILLFKDIFKNLKIQLSGEIKNQIISEIDETVLSDLSLENKLWRLADGETFPIINSKQLSLGFLYSTEGWSFDVDAYLKQIKGKNALSLGFLNPNDSRFHKGEQSIFGIDFYLKKDFNYFKTWISYSFNDVISNYEGLNNNENFISSINIRHSFTTSVAYKLKNFQIALAWNWRSGKPFTKSYVSPNDQFYYLGINTERLPYYHRLDISSTYSFNFSKKNKLKGKLGFSIRNIYNQKNLISREYIGNNNLENSVEIIDKYSLEITPNFLFRITY